MRMGLASRGALSVFSVLAILEPCVITHEQRPTMLDHSLSFPDLYEASIAELQGGLARGQFTSVDLVEVRRMNAPATEAY